MKTSNRNYTTPRMTDLMKFKTVWSSKVLMLMKIKQMGRKSQKLNTRLGIMRATVIKMCLSRWAPATHPRISRKKACSNTNLSIKEAAKLSKVILRSTRYSIAVIRFKRQEPCSEFRLGKKALKATWKSWELKAVMQQRSIEIITIF